MYAWVEVAVNLQNEGIYGSTVGTWLEEPEEGYALQLSTFGQVHSTLESFVTDRSIAFCAGQTATQAPLQDARHLQVIFWKKKCFCAGQSVTQAPLQDARHLQVIFWKKQLKTEETFRLLVLA